MARARWTTPALQDFRAAVAWWREHVGARLAAQVTSEILRASRRAARAPEAYAWVGSVCPSLDRAPRNVRRVLTESRRHVIYYRYHAPVDEVEILAVRGAAQLPPTAAELRV